MLDAAKASKKIGGNSIHLLEMNRLDLEDDAGRRSPAVDGFEASEDGSTSDDEGDVALLNSETRLRGRDPSEESSGATWSQVKDIVVEVCDRNF